MASAPPVTRPHERDAMNSVPAGVYTRDTNNIILGAM